MNNIKVAIEELDKLSRYAELIESPDEFFRHMQGHRTELSLVLSAFSIAEAKSDIKAALEKQIPQKPLKQSKSCGIAIGDCPCCGNYVDGMKNPFYCTNKDCLQNLDWEE